MKVAEKKKVFFDMGLNIVSSAIPVVILQLLLLPLISKYVTGERYGLIITILSVLNVVPSTVGTVLNNVRLLNQKNHENFAASGDYQILLIMAEIVSSVVVFGLCFFYIGVSGFLDIILIIIISILWLAKEYYIVAYRIMLNYKAIFLNNIFLVIGYFVGFVIFVLTRRWQMVYLIGYLISLLYINKTSSIIKEPFIKTNMFKNNLKDTITLIISNILARMVTYADRLILYPLIGGTMVSIYYVSTVLGKVVSIAINPINSVALSYLSKMKNKPDKLFKKTFLLGAGICVIGYTFAVLLSRPVLSVIYPKFVDNAMKYIYITTATVCVNVLTSIITPFVLNFFKLKWQIFINGITIIVYIILTMVLYKAIDMTGFCLGVLITNIVKLLFTLFIYVFNKEGINEIQKDDKKSVSI